MSRVYLGNIINTKSLDDFEAITNGFLAVNKDGKIIEYGEDYIAWKKQNIDELEEIRLESTEFLLPGFIDSHIHASQFPQLGLGLDKTLLDWLNIYTFPLESNYEDEIFAAKVYNKVVETTIKNGTTFAAYFATNHKNSSIILAKEAIAQGQRALVGKVCSNNNCPDFYIETLESSVTATKEFVNDILSLGSDLVNPIITPRFAISCTKELLDCLGVIAKEKNLHIQSHIAENLSEIEFTKTLFGKPYAQVYYDSGLLTEKTIMAHGVHLDDSEIELFKKTKTSVAHCPESNTNLSSGLCDVKRLLNAGIKVGLGTDMSGGNRAGMLNSILRCMDVSHHIQFLIAKKSLSESENYIPLNYKQALYLATLGGAEALALDHITGNFKIGKDFDALLINVDKFPIQNIEIPNKTLDLFDIIQKFVYCGDDRNITKVFVKGKQIKID